MTSDLRSDQDLSADRVLDRIAARRKRAQATEGWSFVAEAASLRALAAEAGGVGVAGLAALDAFEGRITDLIGAALAGRLDETAARVGEGLSEKVFGDKSYVNRLDRQLAVGAAAVALTLADESGVAVVSEALRQAFLRSGVAAPVLPPGSYVVGRGGGRTAGAGGSAAYAGEAASGAGESRSALAGPRRAVVGKAAGRRPERPSSITMGPDGLLVRVDGYGLGEGGDDEVRAAPADASVLEGARP